MSGSSVRSCGLTRIPFSIVRCAASARRVSGAAPIPATTPSHRMRAPSDSSTELPSPSLSIAAIPTPNARIHASVAVLGGDPFRHLGGYAARQEPGSELQQRHVDPARSGARRQFEPDETAAYHDDSSTRLESQAQSQGFIKIAQIKNMLCAWKLETARRRAGGEQESRVGKATAVGEGHAVIRPIDRSHLGAAFEDDVIFLKLSVSQDERGRWERFRGHHRLGERRALIGRMRVVSHHWERPFPTRLAQSKGEARPRLAGADNHHAITHRRNPQPRLMKTLPASTFTG